jgi:hypothetical protein
VRQLAAAFVSQHDIAAKAQASLRTPKSLPVPEQKQPAKFDRVRTSSRRQYYKKYASGKISGGQIPLFCVLVK